MTNDQHPITHFKTAFILLILLAGMGVSCGLGSRVTGEKTPTPLSRLEASATPVSTEAAGATEAPPAPTPTPAPPTAAAAANRLPIKSIVQIWTLDADGELMWSGSGSIISADGYILTNAHVALSDKYYEVHGLLVALTGAEDEPPKPTYRAETVVYDEDLDLAIIRVVTDMDGNALDYNKLNLPAIELGNSDEVGLGAPLRIIGYPGIGGETITLTGGEVAGFTSEAGVKGRAYIKTSATIAGGNSGGAGIDDEGRLIGVPTQLGYGGDEDIVDCRVLADTNNDGVVDNHDACIPTGGFINALRPINLAKPLIQRALSGETMAQATPAPTEAPREPISLPDNAGQVLFEDDFSTDTGQWGLIDGLAIADNQFSFRLTTPSDYIWSVFDGDYGDVDYQVDTRKLGGTDNNSFGQIFRFQDADNFYAYEISSDGFYLVSKKEDGSWSTLIPWTASSVINKGGENQMAVIAQGSQFSFLVNGVQIDTVQDGAFGSGALGLLASSYDEPDVAVAFDNVLVRVPGGQREIAAPAEIAADAALAFQDDFSSPDPNWNLESGNGVERGEADGELVLRVIDAQTDAWSTYSGANFSDMIVEVDARKTAGPDLNNYGVMCRYKDPDNFYFLQLGSDGTYAISRYLDGEGKMLVDWAKSSAINTGEGVNHIRAECVGNTLSLYVNDAFLTSVVDSGLGQGKIALGLGTYDEGDVEVRFDNLAVKTPAGSVSGGGVLVADDFSDNAAGWTEGATDNSKYVIENGEYYLSVLSDQYMIWARTNQEWENIVVAVDARQVEGPADNEYGLICRYQDTDNFYQLSISGDGFYRLVMWNQGEFTELLPWERSSAIKQNGEVNRLRAICSADRIALSVNDIPLFDLTDTTLPLSGDAGMHVGTFDEGGVTLAFDNFVIKNAQ